MMKNIFILLFVFVLNMGFAQSKVGTIDVDFIINSMPEIASIKDNLQEYGATLDNQLNEKMQGYQTKLDDFNNNMENSSQAQMQEKQNEIIALEEDIRQFRQNGLQLLRIREDELKRPLYQKIGIAMEKIAEEENYTQILNMDDTSNVVYMNPDYDITLRVVAELGITLSED